MATTNQLIRKGRKTIKARSSKRKTRRRKRKEKREAKQTGFRAEGSRVPRQGVHLALDMLDKDLLQVFGDGGVLAPLHQALRREETEKEEV